MSFFIEFYGTSFKLIANDAKRFPEKQKLMKQ